MDWHPKPLDPADVTVHRRGRGKPLVLLHCLGMDWRFWDVLEPLADQLELIAYSFPGHHDTALPKGQ
jgi:3-oxoadipate enol-lactonase